MRVARPLPGTPATADALRASAGGQLAVVTDEAVVVFDLCAPPPPGVAGGGGRDLLEACASARRLLPGDQRWQTGGSPLPKGKARPSWLGNQDLSPEVLSGARKLHSLGTALGSPHVGFVAAAWSPPVAGHRCLLATLTGDGHVALWGVGGDWAEPVSIGALMLDALRARHSGSPEAAVRAAVSGTALAWLPRLERESGRALLAVSTRSTLVVVACDADAPPQPQASVVAALPHAMWASALAFADGFVVVGAALHRPCVFDVSWDAEAAAPRLQRRGGATPDLRAVTSLCAHGTRVFAAADDALVLLDGGGAEGLRQVASRPGAHPGSAVAAMAVAGGQLCSAGLDGSLAAWSLDALEPGALPAALAPAASGAWHGLAALHGLALFALRAEPHAHSKRSRTAQLSDHSGLRCELLAAPLPPPAEDADNTPAPCAAWTLRLCSALAGEPDAPSPLADALAGARSAAAEAELHEAWLCRVFASGPARDRVTRRAAALLGASAAASARAQELLRGFKGGAPPADKCPVCRADVAEPGLAAHCSGAGHEVRRCVLTLEVLNTSAVRWCPGCNATRLERLPQWMPAVEGCVFCGVPWVGV